MDLIDRSKLDFPFDRQVFSERDKGFVDGADQAIAVVAAAPTVDAEQVVHCKDCWKKNRRFGPIWCLRFGCQMPEDGFCSFGAKKASHDDEKVPLKDVISSIRRDMDGHNSTVPISPRVAHEASQSNLCILFIDEKDQIQCDGAVRGTVPLDRKAYTENEALTIYIHPDGLSLTKKDGSTVVTLFVSDEAFFDWRSEAEHDTFEVYDHAGYLCGMGVVIHVGKEIK